MATSKSAKIQTEIDKVKAKLAEQQARLKELEQKKLEAENTEIVDIVRGLSISLDELPGGGKHRDRGHRAGPEHLPGRAACAAPGHPLRRPYGTKCPEGYRA